MPRAILISVAEIQHASETLEGTLDQVLFVNDNSGYSVAVVVVAGEHGVSRRVTVVGNLAGLEVGSTIRAEGGFEKHPRFGEQFHVVDFETLRPAGSVAIERYLASEIKGVGPAFARRIAEYFGDALGEVLDNAPERMREVPGIGAARARLIAATWRDASGLREVTVFLRGHGLGGSHARRIHKFYGKNALEVVRQDPYVLARTIHGIGFRTADAIAEKLGIARNSIQRARAAVLYLLERMADEGHVYSPLEYLEGQFRIALEMEPDLARDAVAELAASGDVIVEQAAGHDDHETGGHTCVYLKRLHEAEVNVAKRIAELNAGRAMNKDVVDRAVAAAVKSSELELSSRTEERASMRAPEPRHRDHRRSRNRQDHAVALAARRARRSWDEADSRRSDRARRASAPGGLGPRREDNSSAAGVRAGERRLSSAARNFPLRTNYLIIDEASMMDIELASSLLSALMPNCSLLLVGDRDQLPSVGPGSVLKDVIASDFVPVVQLREVYRQARQSLIVANAHRLNRGEFPQISNDPEGDFSSSSAMPPKMWSPRSSNWCSSAWSADSESATRARSRCSPR